MSRISQETYDETLLENEDVFELDEEEAVKETIEQLESQLQSESPPNATTATTSQSLLDYHVCTAHPNSPVGRKSRNGRALFVQWSMMLDSVVQSDGSVSLHASNDEKAATSAQQVLDALEGIEQFCKVGYINEKEVEEDAEVFTTDTTTGANTNERQCIQIIQFLNLFQSTSTSFTLMSLLGVIDHDFATSTTWKPPKEEERILRKVVSLFTSLLSPAYTSFYKKQRTLVTSRIQDGNESEISVLDLIQHEKEERRARSSIKESFVAMQRVVRLMAIYIQLEKNGEFNDVEEKDDGTGNGDLAILVQLIRLASVACRNSERNKVAFVRALKSSKVDCEENQMYTGSTSNSTIGLVVDGLKVAMEKYNESSSMVYSGEDGCQMKSASDKYFLLMTEFCKLISVLCRFDDTGGGGNGDSNYGSVSSMHDHVLEFGREGVIPILHEVTQLSLIEPKQQTSDEMQNRINLAAASFNATRVIAVNDEIVQSLVAVGSLNTLRLALKLGVSDEVEGDLADENESNKVGSQTESAEKGKTRTSKQYLTAMSIGLVRNLCGNDEIKTKLCLGSNVPSNDTSSASILPSIMKGMKLYRSNALLQEHACGALAAMALRKPTNAIRIIQEHGPREILTAMKQFPTNVLVQRQGALAIRNIVSRLENQQEKSQADGENEGIDARNVFLDLGAEVILREITGRHQGSVDEAYAALRDLGCEVSMVKYDSATNSTTRHTVMFGEVKPQFRAVYDRS